MNTARNKKSFQKFTILFILVVCYGCYFQMEHNELSDVDIIRVLGIDKSADGYKITALYHDNNAGNSDAGMKAMEGEGDSVYQAYENMKRKNNRSLTIGHTSFYLFSDSVCSDGLLNCMDFISRDQTVKTNASVFILENENINTFLKKTIDDKLFIHESLASISSKQKAVLTKIDNTLLDVLDGITDDSKNLLLPYLVADNSSLYPNGYAVFKGDQLYDYLDYDTSLALDLFRKRLRSFPVFLENNVDLEITNYKVNETASLDKQNLILHIQMSFQSDIREVGNNTQIFNEKSLDALQTLQNKYIQSKLDEIISVMKKEKVDLLGIQNLLAAQADLDWNNIQKNWDSYLAAITYQYNIQSKVAKNYIISK
ncbi:Ger(x)C family spore germination protein [Anaeromicropila populeti]|uniref:Germination protein, Ger(X)C family n=1 Tax=Anaeromicropila populeti TaxID=37658 RepID=A0A1I6JVP3_9FIRM|nr:Ger(x)C family spore germination protein [Anaeromicropila populeti]SFR83023.1 germination protein, Ger(x)C family [Anaeromicropila populeti]